MNADKGNPKEQLLVSLIHVRGEMKLLVPLEFLFLICVYLCVSVADCRS